MAAPAVTARIAPVGALLREGYKTVIAFAADPNVSFWEKTLQPIGAEGGEGIDHSTMHNTLHRTKSPRTLIDATDCSGTVAYDPAVYPQIYALINVEGAVTIHFPNLDTLSFYGYLRSFQPNELQEGEAPEATISIVVTNWDPVNNVEQGPVLTEFVPPP